MLNKASHSPNDLGQSRSLTAAINSVGGHVGSPTYGNLNKFEILFLLQNLNIEHMRCIVDSAPVNVRNVLPVSAKRNELLGEVMLLREIEASTLAQTTQQREGLKCPKTTAQGTKQTHMAQSSTAPAQTTFSTVRTPSMMAILDSLRRRDRSLAGVDSSDEEETRRSKKRKESLVKPKFRFGRKNYIKETLMHYRRESVIPPFEMEERLGPEILVKMIQTGQNVEEYVATFPYWRKTPGGQPMHAEYEAFNLAEMIHRTIVLYDSPNQALEHNPSLEIGLCRLHYLLTVEESKAMASRKRPRRV